MLSRLISLRRVETVPWIRQAPLLSYLHAVSSNCPAGSAASTARFSSTLHASNETSSRQQYISFYKYMQVEPAELPMLRKSMLQKWSEFGVLGRVYIAHEGINAQITVPATRYYDFRACLETHPHPLFQGVFFNSGGELTEENNDRPPFHTLHIRVRPRLANDGLTEPLDMSYRGKELSPQEWHNALSDTSRPKRIFDCRNYYEHDVGRFDGAERIMVETFKETFETLDEILENTSKDITCMIYCTGGIRCEKVGAYLTQKGYTDVQRLQGGIVHYAEYVKETNVESKFRGRNFVFDQRLSNANTTITEDVLSMCYTCGAPCNTHTNCSNTLCHGLVIQCAACTQAFQGACSTRCQSIMNKMQDMSPDERRAFAKQNAHHFQHHLVPNGRLRRPGFIRSARSFSTYQCVPSDDLNNYIVDHASIKSASKNLQLEKLSAAISNHWPESMTAKMVPYAQALYLQFLVQSVRAENVLEIGCFTGFSALAMALAVPKPQNVITCDVDPAAVEWTKKYFDNAKIAIDVRLQDGLDLVKEMGRAHRQFDFIFVDGNKSSYTALYDTILDLNLLSKHGMVVFDNTLFRGQVVDQAVGNGNPKDKIAQKLVKLNQLVAQDQRTRSFVVPMWDGMTLVQWNHK
ncbi:hypothetical protein AC1031_009278 [Aphanomyces cochlioides]|nr:hypothetical protein AC1031_009278 [Aphanomyces cochlioides]